jgi:hypothetical protein
MRKVVHLANCYMAVCMASESSGGGVFFRDTACGLPGRKRVTRPDGSVDYGHADILRLAGDNFLVTRASVFVTPWRHYCPQGADDETPEPHPLPLTRQWVEDYKRHNTEPKPVEGEQPTTIPLDSTGCPDLQALVERAGRRH